MPCAAGKVVGIEKHPELVEKVGTRLRLLPPPPLLLLLLLLLLLR